MERPERNERKERQERPGAPPAGSSAGAGAGRGGDPEAIKTFFGQHTEAYRRSPGHRAGADLYALVEALDPRPDQHLLDVATATGHTALTFAPRVAEATGIDLTPAMGEAFAREAAERGVRNARFVVGDVHDLPFPAASFDLVTCRRAAHHFRDVPAALAEMARVLRPGGRLGVVDMTPPAHPAAAALFNDLERIRDASHAWAHPPGRWAAMVEAAGLELERLEVLPDPQPLAAWLAPVPLEPGVLARLQARWNQDEPAIRTQVVTEGPGGWVYVKRRVLLVARKP
ncbi:Methyltransferase type 11 [Thermaerobacter marianensis DSM 12885]|uniref:Methyltransferase type 11 n=1 Tax=Thermaerobacter marianensis (strain ATCC 700841 / DSM 12885 / JCM 10246 / 7p75a) TaxID=644966 RepID=E6SJV5_THEM7|nr:methyltransferase domain-containing protein [Thermaerobacter marianensis]ADU52188.1 Methyltransferase type 11 [Thermaerobacter marianensis DSM 12885]